MINVHNRHAEQIFQINVDDQGEFNKWVQAIKITLRPMWVDPQIKECFLCEKLFTKIKLGEDLR